MLIGGLQKFSLLDYPGKISAIVFTQGCNFRCQFCYNPTLVLPQTEKRASLLFEEAAFFDFLKTRQKKLDAVVVTGGEPTLQPDLPAFLRAIRELGFAVKLDTNGTRPAVLKDLLARGLLDYIAMDIKGAAEKYVQVTGINTPIGDIMESINLLKAGSRPYEFRTTVVPGLIEPDDIAAMGKMIQGAQKWYLQRFKSDTDLVNPAYAGTKAFQESVLEAMRQEAERFVGECYVR